MTLPTFGKTTSREESSNDKVEEEIGSVESEDGDRREDGAFSYVTPLELTGTSALATAPFSSDIAAITPDSMGDDSSSRRFDFTPVPPKRLSKVLGDYEVELSAGYRENDARAIDSGYLDEPQTPPPAHHPPALSTQSDEDRRSKSISPPPVKQGTTISNTKIAGIIIACLVILFVLLGVILYGRNYQAVINSLLQPLSVLRPYIIELTETAMAISTKQISDIVFKMNPKFIVFIVFIMFIAICVPLAGISVCICKICDNFDNLHFPSRSVLGWKVFYCSILLFCIGIVAERIVTCAIATTLLHSAVKGIFPQAETLVYEASKYIDELGPKMINVKGELQDHLNEYDETIEKLRGEFDQKTQAITDETTSNFIIFNSDLNEILVNGSNRVLSMESEIQQIVFDIFSGNSAVAEKLESNNCQDDIHCEEILLSIKALVPYNVSVSFEALSDTFLSSLDILSNSSLLITAQNISDTLLFVKEASEGTADEVFGRFNDYRETIGKESSGQIEAAIMLVSEFKGKVFSNGEEIISGINRIAVSFEKWSAYFFIASVVIITLVSIILIFYLVASVAGLVGLKLEANSGKSLMSAALSLSFIFSWIFLLISLTAFLFGSHTERYLCQGLQRNSNGTIELLEVIDEVLEIRRPDLMKIEGLTVSLEEIVTQCENENSFLFEPDGFAVEKSPEFEIEIWNTSFNSNATLFTQADLEALVAINETLSTFNDDLQIQSLYPDLYRLSVKCEILAGQLNLTVFNLLENNDNNDEIIANQIQALQTYSFQLSRNFLRQSFERNFNLIQYEIEEMQQLISKSIINFNKTIGSFPVYNDRISNTVVEILSEAKIKSNNISNTYADKLSSLGECSVIYDVYQESVDFLCAKVSHAINLFWISLGFASIVIIIMIFFGHKFHKTDVFW